MKTFKVDNKIFPIFRRYQVKTAGLFGSRARGDAKADSDYDFLVNFEKAPSLVKLIRMENELEGILGTKVDIVIEGSEKAFVKASLEKDLTPIYG
jgi:hypothetical protein